MNVYIHKPVNYSDMQGPCDSGFHVPSSDEWVRLKSIMESLSLSTSTGYSIYLHIPKCGQRKFTDGTVGNSGEARYSCCDGKIISTNGKYTKGGLTIYSDTISISASPSTAGLSIRPFKNRTIVPDSSWTTIYQGTGDAGIFWNTSEGIISLSSDGINWITISDKNCGANTVYSNGDTMSESNCGKFYQRGNNYGFAFTGTLTTSSTKVDDSNYGPGNYYSSSTFIITSSDPRQWGTSDNLNLRGGVTGAGGETELKNAYIGEYVEIRTFTISWTEKSDMSSGWTYSDDATGLTAGSTAFDDFFGYSAVKLASNGTESAIVNQNAGVLDITQLGTLTSGDNVMIKFPVRGIKMSKSGSVVTLSITDGIGRESEGYQYYAFQNTGDIVANASTTVATTPLYMGAYLSYTNGSKLQSWSGQTPQGNYTMGNAISYAGANGTGWTIAGWYQRCLINAYYMMKYGNPNSQSVIGRGFVDSNSAAHTTGGTNSYTNASWGENTGKYQCKLFGLEDWWGNQFQWVGGMFTDGSKNMYTALHDFTANMSTSENQYKNAGTINDNNNFCISSILGTNKGMFGPTAAVNNSSFNTYYCDNVYAGASCLARVGGTWSGASSDGVFDMNVDCSASNAFATVGARLMFL